MSSYQSAIGLLSFFIFFSFSCTTETSVEEKIIERAIFIELLADAQLFESTQQFVKNKNLGFDLDDSYNFIFEKYNVTREDFETSLKHYAGNPEGFEQMYDEVIVVLTEKQATKTK